MFPLSCLSELTVCLKYLFFVSVRWSVLFCSVLFSYSLYWVKVCFVDLSYSNLARLSVRLSWFIFVFLVCILCDFSYFLGKIKPFFDENPISFCLAIGLSHTWLEDISTFTIRNYSMLTSLFFVCLLHVFCT